ncbi:hypothetical protein [Lentibacillus amyloliquefaciens]|uniref:hypothetical protein n=1 Tax=Lentibacillus amyloliquefaciens TaxID=1472767 RepID=UPI0012E3AC79|nr:hypothetical protein [Lentibacillus amyloliquefaciens]
MLKKFGIGALSIGLVFSGISLGTASAGPRVGLDHRIGQDREMEMETEIIRSKTSSI